MSPQPTSSPNPKNSGLTFKSILLSACGIALVAAITQVAGVLVNWDRSAGTEAISTAVFSVVFALLLASGLAQLVLKKQLLSKPEMVCFTYMLLIAAPLCTHGFWRTIPGVLAGITRQADTLDYLTVLDERMLPYGPDVFENAQLSNTSDIGIQKLSDETLLTFGGPDDEREQQVTYTIPLDDENLSFGSTYFFYADIRAIGMQPGSLFEVSYFADDNETRATEIIRATRDTTESAFSLESFERKGKWGLSISETTQETITVRMRKRGAGTIEVRNPRFLNVTALESFFTAKPITDSEAYAAIDKNRTEAINKRPSFFASPEGLYVLAVYNIDWSMWSKPLLSWGSFVGILMIGSFGMCVILRRQWVDNERFPLPMMAIGDSFLSNTAYTDDSGKRQPLWTNKLFIAGVVLALVYCSSQALNAFSSSFPTFRFNISIASYLSNSAWGETWNRITFSVFALAFGIGLLMELNVLISFVVGFLFFRLQYWFGESTGLATDKRYPYVTAQLSGGILGYALITVILLRKYLIQTLKDALRGVTSDNEETVGYRSGYFALILSLICMCVWAMVFGLSPLHMLWLFVVFMSFFFVAAKMRAECGIPTAMTFLSKSKGSLLVPLALNFAIFPVPEATVAILLSALIFAFGFLNLSGVQLEFLEFAKRERIKRWHVPASITFAFVCSLVVGGWFMINSGNSVGVLNVRNFGEYTAHFQKIEAPLLRMETATNLIASNQAAIAAGDEPAKAGLTGSDISMIFGALTVTILTIIRQIFAGFWMHPMGYLFGLTDMAQSAWGALFAAWVVRLLVLKLGGAGTVRRALKPFALGIITGTILSFLVYNLIATGLYQNGMVGSTLSQPF